MPILWRLPTPPNLPLLRALWSEFNGIWGSLEGSCGVLTSGSLEPQVLLRFRNGQTSNPDLFDQSSVEFCKGGYICIKLRRHPTVGPLRANHWLLRGCCSSLFQKWSRSDAAPTHEQSDNVSHCSPWYLRRGTLHARGQYPRSADPFGSVLGLQGPSVSGRFTRPFLCTASMSPYLLERDPKYGPLFCMGFITVFRWLYNGAILRGAADRVQPEGR